VFAKDQPQYRQLPAFIDHNSDEKTVVSCYSMSFREQIKLLFTNKIWLLQMTFGKALQPQRMEVDKDKVFVT
jgi:hypothetical protein